MSLVCSRAVITVAGRGQFVGVVACLNQRAQASELSSRFKTNRQKPDRKV